MGKVEDAPIEMHPQTAGSITLTIDQLKEVIASAIAAGVKEATKPTPEQEEKMVEDKKRKDKAQQARIEVGKAAERERTMRQQFCNHKRDDGRADSFAVGGQLFSDGKVHILCLRCQKEVKVYSPTAHEFAEMQP